MFTLAPYDQATATHAIRRSIIMDSVHDDDVAIVRKSFGYDTDEEAIHHVMAEIVDANNTGWANDLKDGFAEYHGLSWDAA